MVNKIVNKILYTFFVLLIGIIIGYWWAWKAFHPYIVN